MLTQAVVTPMSPQPSIVAMTTFLKKLDRSRMIRQVTGAMWPPPSIVTTTTFSKILERFHMIRQVLGTMWSQSLIVMMTTFLRKLEKTPTMTQLSPQSVVRLHIAPDVLDCPFNVIVYHVKIVTSSTSKIWNTTVQNM